MALIDENKLTFAEFNIGDKVVVTGSRYKDEHALGIVKEFGYNHKDELILGVEVIQKFSYNPTTDKIFWFHPRSTVDSIEKI